MLRRIYIVLTILTLGGCAMMPQPTRAPMPYGMKLPAGIAVEDGTGGTLNLQLASIVAGGGITSAYGSRGFSMGGAGGPKHEGIDILAPYGAPVRAAAAGTVADMGWRGAYGRFVLIRHAGRIETAYAHLSAFGKTLALGRPVHADEIIGYIGTTGNSTGAHLHYEVRRNGTAIDPLAPPAGILQQITGLGG